MPSINSTFIATPHDQAAKTWVRIAAASKSPAEREHATRMAQECRELADAEAKAQAEVSAAEGERPPAPEPSQFECYCGKTFGMKAHLGKHKKSCQLAQIAEGKDEETDSDGSK